MRIKLKCNPYKRENLIKIEGKVYNESKLLKYKDLYAYELREEFLTDLIDELNTRDLTIEFYGTKYDCEEIWELVSRYNEKHNTEIKIVVERIVDVLDKRKEIEELALAMINSNVPELRDEQLIDGIYKELNNPVKVAVIATMSSGKSTLINSMVAQKIMPSKSGACTSKIVTINHKPLTDFKLKSVDGIEKNKIINVEDMKLLNDKEGIKEIEIEGNIKALDNIKNLQLIDTPGPNNSLNGSHKKTTMEYIKSGDKPIILFVLDGSKLLTDDEAYLIEVIADETKRDGKVDEERFIFAINKSDDFKKDDSIVKIKEDVKRKLREYGIKNPNIHFIAAQNALLSRLDDNGVELSEDEEDDLYLITRKAARGTYNFYLESDLSPKVRSKLEKIAGEAKGNKKVLVTSGMLGLELTIKELVNKYKDISLVRNCIENCSKIIKEKNILKIVRNQMEMKKEEMKELEANIIKINNFLNENDVREEFKNDINNIKFPDTFRQVVKRVHTNFSKLQKDAESISTESIDGGEYIKKTEAERYMKEFMKKYEDITIDLQSEFDRFIKYGIYEVGEKIIQEYKNKLQGFINILNCESNMLSEYVKCSIPDYKGFIKESAINKKKEYIESIPNPKKQGFFGKLKFWQPSYIDVTRTVNIKVIDKKEIVNFTFGIFKDLNLVIKSMTDSIEKHKEKAKETLILNLDELNHSIENKLNNLKEIINNKAEIEVAITEDNNKLNTIEDINEKLEKILLI
ncbi:dynamin family protein [Clostridium sp. Sa3CUN1]|uniref:Dynamin family protein n=1 Tax=Clostridium gallinarum TaxID=2762246 RepID=A0ABR8Q6M0_9CLOT|nr:dynamin family protein [Clostridium gallinarum]MBD7916076.1 dynamin family protein [Clostridium gallinarum]